MDGVEEGESREWLKHGCCNSEKGGARGGCGRGRHSVGMAVGGFHP